MNCVYCDGLLAARSICVFGKMEPLDAFIDEENEVAGIFIKQTFIHTCNDCRDRALKEGFTLVGVNPNGVN